MDLQGKRVWITGASSGIGESLALAFAEAGAQLILSARREDALRSVAQRCAGEVDVVVLDVMDEAAVAATAADVLARHGGVDILVNNAGVTQRAPAVDTDMSVYRRLMEVNFFGAVALTSAVLPSMIAAGQGQIVNMASVAGKLGAPQRTGYCAAKHALVGYSDALRSEVHDTGVRVLVVCPGFVNTPISYSALTGDGKAHGTMDAEQAGGVPAELVATRTLDAIRHGREEILVGGKEIQAVRLKRFAPGLVSRLTRKLAANRTG